MRSSNVPFDSFNPFVRTRYAFDLSFRSISKRKRRSGYRRRKFFHGRNIMQIYFFLSKRLESRVVIVPNRSTDKFATCRFEQRGTTTTTKLRDLIKPRSTKFHACTKRCNSLEAQIPVSPAARMRSVRGSRTEGGGGMDSLNGTRIDSVPTFHQKRSREWSAYERSNA